jgi:WD40 repeat protein
MLLTPQKTINLEHRAYYIAQALDGSKTAVASDSRVSVFDAKSGPTILAPRWGKVRSVSLHPTGSLLAVAHDDNLTMIDFSKAAAVVLKAPKLHEQTENIERGFDDCHFDQQGNLWCVAPISPSHIELQYRKPSSWAVDAKTFLDDPFGYSSSSLFDTPDPDELALWIAAGQDGQRVYWISRNGEIEVEAEEFLCDTTPPVFGPGGNDLLVNGNYLSVDRYSFPDIEVLGSCAWPFEDNVNDCFAESITYIDNQRALVSSRDGRLFVIDLNEMSVMHEVEVAGHEPRPCNVIYPNLADDTDLCSDISYFRSFGDSLLMNFRRDGGVGLEGWKDSLLLFSLKSLSDSLRK